jgi:hypothetical protein
VRAAALPGSARQGGGDRVDETGVRVRGQQADAAEAARDQRAQQRQPGGAVLGRDDVEAERLAEAVPVDADRVHDADVDRVPALAALHHQRVERQVRIGAAVERAAAEVVNDLVQRLRQPGDLALAHPVDPELLHQLLNPPGGDARQIGVGDDRHECLLGPPARLQQPFREIRALAQLRDGELDRADAPVPVTPAVAVGRLTRSRLRSP